MMLFECEPILYILGMFPGSSHKDNKNADSISLRK